MKCNRCEKPATFHITELTEPEGPKVLHLCEEHAREFLATDSVSPSSAISSVLAKQLKMEKVAEEIEASDKKTCPVCGITFAEFRKGGRLGCAYDYVAFEDDLEPLLVNIHSALGHSGKVPKNLRGSPERQRQLAQLREQMKSAIKKEEYEKASGLRDQIAAIEAGQLSEEETTDEAPPPSDSFQSNPHGE
jgi:protein arginine kinase activator